MLLKEKSIGLWEYICKFESAGLSACRSGIAYLKLKYDKRSIELRDIAKADFERAGIDPYDVELFVQLDNKLCNLEPKTPVLT